MIVNSPNQKPTVWVLLYEINDYNQQGYYFAAAFVTKPTKEELQNVFECEEFGVDADDELLNHLLDTGGGRRLLEDEWYWLKPVENGKTLFSHDFSEMGLDKY